MSNSVLSLFELRSFKIAFWAPITLSLSVMVYIALTSQLEFKSGYAGLNFALEIFKVPLTIFAIIFPSVALVTANHRSIQSKKQIEITLNQNRLSVRPHLSDLTEIIEGMFLYRITNDGLGTALYEYFHIYWNNVLVNSREFEHEINTIKGKAKVARIGTSNNAGALAKDKNIPVIEFTFDTSEEAHEFSLSLNEYVRFEISYKSMYGDDYLFNGKILG
jgi:hypothetical protein